MKASEKYDNERVNPAHYKGDYVMRVIEDFKLDFCTGNVVKYILRAGSKPETPPITDLKKAAWYLARKIGQLEATLPITGTLPTDEKEEKRED